MLKKLLFHWNKNPSKDIIHRCLRIPVVKDISLILVFPFFFCYSYTSRVVTNGLKAQMNNPELIVRGLDPQIGHLIDKLKHFNQVSIYVWRTEKAFVKTFFVCLLYWPFLPASSPLLHMCTVGENISLHTLQGDEHSRNMKNKQTNIFIEDHLLYLWRLVT